MTGYKIGLGDVEKHFGLQIILGHPQTKRNDEGSAADDRCGWFYVSEEAAESVNKAAAAVKRPLLIKIFSSTGIYHR